MSCLKRLVHFSHHEFNELEKIDELSGKMARNSGNKLMHTVVESDNQKNNGKLISKSIDQGLGSFNPDLTFQQLTTSFSMTKNLYGETLLRQITGYSADYLEKNIKIPEFKRELKNKIAEKFLNLRKDNLIDDEGMVTEEGLEVAALVMFNEEMDHLMPSGIGEKMDDKPSIYGMKSEKKPFNKDSYKNISIRDTVKKAVRRGHTQISAYDLVAMKRQSKGQLCLIYALDASGSMRGDKLEMSKKAGIALAYKAISEKDKVGLIIFSSGIVNDVEPCQEFPRILKEITRVRASNQTNFVQTIKRAIELFSSHDETKHLVLLTDALPTSGKEPEKETIEAVSIARSCNITISIVGINLDKKGKEFARKIAEIGEGRFYVANKLEELDTILLEDYYYT